jgi:hypothetical protein
VSACRLSLPVGSEKTNGFLEPPETLHVSRGRKNCMKTKIMTVDLENDLRSNRCKSIEIIVPKLLDFFDDQKIKSTFFVVTSLLEKYETEIKEIAKKHEIASHSHTHAWLNNKNVEFEISESKRKMKEFGIKCQGFRAPGFITTKNHFSLLKKNGYSYDSSLATYYPGRYNNLSLPNKPFLKEGIVTFPMANFVYPVISSGLPYLKLLDPISKLFPQKNIFYLHPWELLEKKDLPVANSIIKSFLRRNSGKNAWKIFVKHINKEESKWIGCQDWITQYF